MDNSTPTALLSGPNIQIFNYFSIKVVVNIFLYSVAATFGVLVATNLIKAAKNLFLLRYKRYVEDIKELNNKVHDRLVEIEKNN